MNWLQSTLYGFVSGLSEFIPVSSQAHQSLLRNLFGLRGTDALLNAIVHAAVLLALITECWGVLEQIQRDGRMRQRYYNGAGKVRNSANVRFIRAGVLPLLACLIVFTYISKSLNSLATVALLLLLNGFVLFAPCRMLQGNKDARAMSGADAILVGASGALSTFPGISGIGTMISVSLARGADRNNALNWAFLLYVPALAAMTAIDLLALITLSGTVRFTEFIGYILAATGAYAGGYLGIVLMKFLSIKTGFTGFSYYCWGAALFAFILFLI